MKHLSLCVAAAVCSAIIIGTALAFTEPTGVPPTKNVAAPLNVGAGTQEKAGNLIMQNMKASSITLGESTRTSWLDAGSACSWEGWKCNCKNDGSSFAYIAITIGAQCSSGQLRDFRIVGLQLSSKGKTCPVTPPIFCKPSLYTYENVSGVSGGDAWYNPFGW